MEIGTTAVSAGTRPVKVPATSVSESTSWSRKVERYSRRSAHPSGRRPSRSAAAAPVVSTLARASALRADASRPSTAVMRIEMSGTESMTSAPAARTLSCTPSRWSDWMSNRMRSGRPPPSSGSATWPSTERWTSQSVATRNVPSPSVRSSVSVWLPGR